MYEGTATDVKIRTDDYDKLASTNSMVCNPKLKNGKLFSFQDVECSIQGISMSAMMRLIIGQPVSMYFKFGEEGGKTYLQTDDFAGALKLYKVSNSTTEPGSTNVALIVIIVIIVIVVIVAIIFVLWKRKGQPTRKHSLT